MKTAVSNEALIKFEAGKTEEVITVDNTEVAAIENVTNGEEENAANTTADAIDAFKTISDCEYRTLLSWVEKYSNGQHDAYFPLKAKITEWLKIDVKDDELSNILNATDNRVAFGRFMHDNQIMVIGEGGFKYAVMTVGNDVYLDDWDSCTVEDNAAEVQEEEKMLKVSKEKLAAYEKATNAENNRVTVYFNGNRKQFEVYGTYYVKRKVNCARGAKVYKEVEMVDWHKASQKDVAEILKNYGLTVDEFVAIANGDYEEETAEVEEVTAETTAEIEKLEKKLASLKFFAPNTNEYMAACIDTIKNCYARIAQVEDKLWEFQLEKENYERDVTALENEIANCKLIDVTDEIVTADAVDASVATMIELNAANFTAAKLIDAVNAADKAVEVVPVTFELQNFAADADIAEGVATIDTSISGTVIPVIDEDAEDAEIKNQLAEIADLANREKELGQKIAALQKELHAVRAEYSSQYWTLTKRVKNLMDEAYKTVKTAFEKRTEFGYIQINGIMMTSWHWDEYNAVRTKFNESGFALWFYDDTVTREYQLTEIVKYSTLKQFKAAISELVAAIERGDKTFTFPADETADK